MWGIDLGLVGYTFAAAATGFLHLVFGDLAFNGEFIFFLFADFWLVHGLGTFWLGENWFAIGLLVSWTSFTIKRLIRALALAFDMEFASSRGF